MRNRKILFLVNHEIVIYNFRREIVERLLAEGYEVHVSSPGGRKIEHLTYLGCVHHEINFNRHGLNPKDDLKILKEYKRLIRNLYPKIVFTFTIKPNIYGAIAAKKYKVPIVANITGLGTALENKSVLQSMLIGLYKYAFTNVQTVFFQNQENMDFFRRKGIAIDKHKLLPGSGVNLEHFQPIAYPSNKSIEFVFISRIMKEKGIDQYLEAAKVIRLRYPNTRFHICGFCEEEYEEELENLEVTGIITYHGLIDDIREIFKITHCTIHPTYYPEGMSNVLLESCACGRPIITTDRSGCREIVDDGINGFVIQKKNTKDLIEKIEKFLHLSQDERERMGLKGREKMIKEFNREIVVNKYIGEIR